MENTLQVILSEIKGLRTEMNQRFEEQERKFDQKLLEMEERFDNKLDIRFAEQEMKFDEKLDTEYRLSKVEEKQKRTQESQDDMKSEIVQQRKLIDSILKQIQKVG